MRDFFGVLLSVAVPWIAGTLWIRALADRRPGEAAGIDIGYGYIVGLFGTTLAMRGLSLAGVQWTVAWIALPVVAATLVAYFFIRPYALLRRPAGASAAFHALPALVRGVFWLLLLLTGVRAVMLGMEVALSPLVPFDAWAQWATKARVWYEFGRMEPFVQASEWSKAAGNLHFTDTHPDYPATIPLFQAWTALCIGRWDESLINAPWIAGFVSLGVAFYAQVRGLGFSALKAMFGAYVLLSLPFLTVHVALAGIADLFVAIAYGLTAMALWQWSITRCWRDGLVALVLAIVCASLKDEGVFWVLTLVPAIVVALNRRVGLGLVVAAGLTAALYLTFGPDELTIMHRVLRTHFVDVSRPLFEHMFVMDNWHLFWYAAVAVIAFNVRRLARLRLAPISVMMLAAFAFIFVVYFLSNASGGVLDDGLTNRLLLQVVPAALFYLALILNDRSSQHQAKTAAL